MALGWLFPLGLAGLVALLVPLLLHLARRRSQRVLPFAAMRWLPTGRAPRRKLRLQEHRLLVLRLLLVALAALWLAQPLVQDFGSPRSWLAVAPGVDADAARQAARDFDRAVWLRPGLPALDASSHGDASHHWTSLLQEFTARLPHDDTATVLVPESVPDLGERLPTLSHRLTWREAPTAAHTASAPPPPLLALRHASADATELHWLRAAIAAWDQHPRLRVRLDDAPATTPVPPAASAILWVGALPEHARVPNLPLLHIPSSPAPSSPPKASTEAPTHPFTPLPTTAAPAGPAAWRTLATPLHPATLPALYDPAFPSRLHATLFGPPRPGRIPAARLQHLDVHPPPDDASEIAIAPRGLRDLPLSPLLAWLLLALFLLERWFATGPRLERTR